MSEHFIPTHKFFGINLRSVGPPFDSAYARSDKMGSYSKRRFADIDGMTYVLPLQLVEEIKAPPKEGEVWVFEYARLGESPTRVVSKDEGSLVFRDSCGDVVNYIPKGEVVSSYRKVLNSDGSVYEKSNDE